MFKKLRKLNHIVLAKYDEKYDLSKLNVPITPIKFDKRPILQLYTAGSSSISCFSGSSYWEENVDIVENNISTLQNSYHFTQVQRFHVIEVTGGGVPQAVTGAYISSEYYNPMLYEGRNGIYQIDVKYTSSKYYYDIIVADGGSVLFRAGPYASLLSSGTLDFVAVNGEGTLTGN